MVLPFNDVTTFIYSFYGICILILFAVKSVSIAIVTFKKGLENA